MRVLVVGGAGAVGQVYALHLQRGGADVGLLVREPHVEAARRGWSLYPLNEPDGTVPRLLVGCTVVTELAGAAGWDLVVLATSSTPIFSPWMAEFGRAVDGTPIVVLHGREEVAAVRAAAPKSAVGQGVISLIAYAAPLPGETRFPRPGVAYWVPPFSALPFAGPDAAVARIVEVLREGGMPARRAADLSATSIWGALTLNIVIASLEGASWSFDRMFATDAAALACRAVEEGCLAQARTASRPLWTRAVRPWGLWGAARLAPRVIPLPIETYLGVHFTKVGDQVRHHLVHTLEDARSAATGHAALEEVLRRLDAARARK